MEEESLSLFEEKPKMGALFNHKKASQQSSLKGAYNEEKPPRTFNNSFFGSQKGQNDATQEPQFNPPNPIESRLRGSIVRDFSFSR